MASVNFKGIKAFAAGDDPTAGSQDYATQVATPTGLNGNWAWIVNFFSYLFVEVSGNLTSTLKSAIIGTAQLINDAVDRDKINANVAGIGLQQNVNGSLEVKYNGTLAIDGEGKLGTVASYPVSWSQVFSMKNRGEALAIGQTPSNPSTVKWDTKTVGDETKAVFSFIKPPGSKYLAIYFNIKTSSVGGTHYFTSVVNSGAFSNTQTASGTFEATSEQFNSMISVDMTTIADYDTVVVTLRLKTNSGSYTTTVDDCLVYTSNSIPAVS